MSMPSSGRFPCQTKVSRVVGKTMSSPITFTLAASRASMTAASQGVQTTLGKLPSAA